MSETNPLLGALKLPGRIFQIPSRGIFYTNGELSPFVKNGELHVRAMSALDEINLKNPDQLFSGDALNTVFKTCIDGIEKPTELLAKDVDAIMLFLRTVTYGPDYEFIAKHNCENAKEHSYVGNVDEMIGKSILIDPTLVEKEYSVTLPNSQVVHLNPNRYRQILDVIKMNQGQKEITVEIQKENLIMMLLAVVNKIDNVTDRKHIEEWLRTAPVTYINRIALQSESINNWGPNLKYTCKCKDCGTEFEVDIPINPVTFFTE